MEKYMEYDADLHMLFVDFKQAFDSIDRAKICEIFNELKIPKKLTRQVIITLKGTSAKVVLQRSATRDFEIRTGVKQGDGLSTTIFNLILHYAIKDLYNGGNIMIRSYQIMTYADVTICARTMESLTDTFVKLEKRTKDLGLIVNVNKTKYLKVSRKDQKETDRNISMAGSSFERVQNFIYLGAYLSSKNNMHEEIAYRIMAANKAYYSFSNLFKSKLISRACKLALYKTIVRPILCYNAETWTLSAIDENNLRMFERKILRKNFKPAKDEDNYYLIRFNHELLELMGNEDVVKFIKAQRLRWAGHLERMDEGRAPRRASEMVCMTTRRRGRPRTLWREEVESDLRRMSTVNNWRGIARDRYEWRRIVLQAKAHPEL